MEEDTIYERPREKLRNRGVTALTNTELIQLLIGSGTRTISGARIAKNVAVLLQEITNVSYDALLQIPGLGTAKTSQLVAAIELGARMHAQPDDSSVSQMGFNSLRKAAKRRIEYTTIDGQNKAIRHYVKEASSKKIALLAVKQVFAYALRDRAHAVQLGVGMRNQNTATVTEDELSIIKFAFTTADLLEIKLDAVWLVGQHTQVQLKRKALL